jgi:hypothetical protein
MALPTAVYMIRSDVRSLAKAARDDMDFSVSGMDGI